MTFTRSLQRRQVLKGLGSLGGLAILKTVLPSYAWSSSLNAVNSSIVRGGPARSVAMDLSIASEHIDIAGSRASATTINGGVPGPLIELWEGKEALLRVNNRLSEDTSLHWHGILLPFEMDGVRESSQGTPSRPGFRSGNMARTGITVIPACKSRPELTGR